MQHAGLGRLRGRAVPDRRLTCWLFWPFRGLQQPFQQNPPTHVRCLNTHDGIHEPRLKDSRKALLVGRSDKVARDGASAIGSTHSILEILLRCLCRPGTGRPRDMLLSSCFRSPASRFEIEGLQAPMLGAHRPSTP